MLVGSLFLLVGILLVGIVLRIYVKDVQADATRERLRAGVIEEIPEQVSMWRDAADLLQITRMQRLMATSPIIRQLEQRLRQLTLRYSIFQVITIVVIMTSISAGILHLMFSEAAYTVAGILILPLAGWWILSTLAEYRVKKVEAQLPGFINQMITTLRSGGVPTAALQAASINTPSPLGPSIGRLVESINIGMSPTRAWKEWASLWKTPSCDLLSTAIRLKWEAGGEMTTLLVVILDQIESRRRRELRIQNLTAMAQLSTYVLIALPIVLFIYTYYVSPTVINDLVEHPIGKRALWTTCLLLIVGFFWMRKIARLDNN